MIYRNNFRPGDLVIFKGPWDEDTGVVEIVKKLLYQGSAGWLTTHQDIILDMYLFPISYPPHHDFSEGI